MNDLTRNRQTPAEEDPLVHGFLVTLPHFAPQPGIENRILMHVWLPLPAWLRRAREQARSPAGIRAIWTVVGVFAAATAVTASAVISLTLAYWPDVTAALGWTVENVALPAWRGMLMFSAGVLPTLNTTIGALAPRGTTLMLGAAGSILIFALCALGLRRTMRLAGSWRVSSHDSR